MSVDSGPPAPNVHHLPGPGRNLAPAANVDLVGRTGADQRGHSMPTAEIRPIRIGPGVRIPGEEIEPDVSLLMKRNTEREEVNT
jgi:hypothetical protein